MTPEERTCGTCKHYKNGECALCSGFCLNDPRKPLWEPRVVATPIIDCHSHPPLQWGLRRPPLFSLENDIIGSQACQLRK